MRGPHDMITHMSTMTQIGNDGDGGDSGPLALAFALTLARAPPRLSPRSSHSPSSAQAMTPTPALTSALSPNQGGASLPDLGPDLGPDLSASLFLALIATATALMWTSWGCVASGDKAKPQAKEKAPSKQAGDNQPTLTAPAFTATPRAGAEPGAASPPPSPPAPSQSSLKSSLASSTCSQARGGGGG